MRYAFALCLLLGCSTALFAQSTKGVGQTPKGTPVNPSIFYPDPVDPCADMTIDECMASGGTTTTTRCTDSYGCPQCGMNQTLTGAVCYRLFGNWGYCSCLAQGVAYDKNGIKYPVCKTSGSCTQRS